jgi:hypothetical protein
MSKEPETVTLLGITKEEVGDGWSAAFSVSEYEIPHNHFLKYCKRVAKSEPDTLPVLLSQVSKKVKVLLGF